MRVVYPGTFDPFTLGHLDVLKRICKLYDEVIVLVSHSSKKTWFSMEERVQMIEEIVKSENMCSVDVLSYSGLLVDFLKDKGIKCIVRGLRAVSDFEYELQMALMNRRLNRNIETVFLMTADEYSYVSSTLVKEIALHGGDITPFVHPSIVRYIKEKVNDLR